MGNFDLLDFAGEASGEEAVAKVVNEVVPRSLSKEEKKLLHQLKKKQPQKEELPMKQQPQDGGGEGQEYSGEGGRLGGGQGLAGGQQDPGRGWPNGRGNFNGNGGRSYFNGNRSRGSFNDNRGGHGYYRNFDNSNFYNNSSNRVYNSNGNAADNRIYSHGDGKPGIKFRPHFNGKSEYSAGDAAKDQLKKNPGKEKSNDGDASKKAGAIKEKKQEMTLAEYEKMLGKKPLVPPEPVERKMDPTFEGLKPLEKKKMLESDQRKPKEVAAKKGKATKLTIQEYQPADDPDYVTHSPRRGAQSMEYVPPPPPPKRGAQSGGYRDGRGGAAYNGRKGLYVPPERPCWRYGPQIGGDSSSESQVHSSDLGNTPIVFHDVDATNGNSAPRRYRYQQPPQNGYQQGGYNGAYQQGGGRVNGGYNGARGNGARGNVASQQGGGRVNVGYNGARGNGAYLQGGGRINGGYQERQQGYNGGYQGSYQQGEHRQGGYQERQQRYNGEHYQGSYQQGEHRQGAYQQGGNLERRDGGYQQGGNQEGRDGGYNGGGYQRAVGAATPAGSKAKAPSPSQSQA